MQEQKYYRALLHRTSVQSGVCALRMFDLALEKEQNGLWAKSMTLSDLVIFIVVAQSSCLTYFFILFFILVEKGCPLADLPIITVTAGFSQSKQAPMSHGLRTAELHSVFLSPSSEGHCPSFRSSEKKGLPAVLLAVHRLDCLAPEHTNPGQTCE